MISSAFVLAYGPARCTCTQNFLLQAVLTARAIILICAEISRVLRDDTNRDPAD